MRASWFSIPAFLYNEIPAGLFIREVLIELRNAHTTFYFIFTFIKCRLECKDPIVDQTRGLAYAQVVKLVNTGS